MRQKQQRRDARKNPIKRMTNEEEPALLVSSSDGGDGDDDARRRRNTTTTTTTTVVKPIDGKYIKYTPPLPAVKEQLQLAFSVSDFVTVRHLGDGSFSEVRMVKFDFDSLEREQENEDKRGISETTDRFESYG